MTAPRGVIVTGGTGALGRAVVRLLLGRGSRVAVPYRRADEWHSLRDEILAIQPGQALAIQPGQAGAALVGLEADLSDLRRAQAFVDEATAKLGVLDGVALVAGGWSGGTSFEAAPPDEWSRMLRLNLDTAAHVCRAALPHLQKQGGSVVAVGSRAAETGGAGMAAYAVSKVALHALVRVLAQENRERGVRFNAVLPGTIDTPANRSAMPKADRATWTSPQAIAEVVAFLLSSASAPTTGALVPVDAPA